MRHGRHITKRGEVYYFRRKFKGKLICQSLGIGDRRAAEARAKDLDAALEGQRWDQIFAARDSAPGLEAGPLIGTILPEYEARRAVLGLKPATAHNNALALLWVVRKAGYANPELQPVSVLNGKLVRNMKAAVSKECDAAGDSPERRRQRMYSANATLRQARGIFKPMALRTLADAGFRLTIDESFRKEQNFERVDKRDYQPASDELLVKTFRVVDLLATRGGLDNRNAFKAICLAVGAGLRASELTPARWGWFVKLDGMPYLRTNAVTKNGELLQLPMVPEWFDRLMSVKPAGAADDDFVLEADGQETDRTREPSRRVGRIMKVLGWKTQKRLHEFRALVGCRIAEKHGIEAASLFLRHGSIALTQKHYGRYLKLRSLEGVKMV
jgi:integrase